MHILGIGLPRTGTTSLTKFLRNLGFSGENFCVIHDNRENDLVKIKEKSFLIDNSAYRNYKQKIINSNLETKFILTTRDKKSWKQSINRMKTKKLNIPKDLPDINLYYIEVIEFFKSKELINRLLVIDLNNINMEKIFNFLEIENEMKIEYPKELIN